MSSTLNYISRRHTTKHSRRNVHRVQQDNEIFRQRTRFNHLKRAGAGSGNIVDLAQDF